MKKFNFEIKLNGDSSQILITETEEPIADNIYSEDLYEWDEIGHLIEAGVLEEL